MSLLHEHVGDLSLGGNHRCTYVFSLVYLLFCMSVLYTVLVLFNFKWTVFSPDTKYKARFISSHIHKCEVHPAVGDSGAGGTQVE